MVNGGGPYNLLSPLILLFQTCVSRHSKSIDKWCSEFKVMTWAFNSPQGSILCLYYNTLLIGIIKLVVMEHQDTGEIIFIDPLEVLALWFRLIVLSPSNLVQEGLIFRSSCTL